MCQQLHCQGGGTGVAYRRLEPYQQPDNATFPSAGHKLEAKFSPGAELLSSLGRHPMELSGCAWMIQ